MQWTVAQNAYQWWDLTHKQNGFMETFEFLDDALRQIKKHKENKGYVAIVAGGNGAASGVCE